MQGKELVMRKNAIRTKKRRNRRIPRIGQCVRSKVTINNIFMLSIDV